MRPPPTPFASAVSTDYEVEARGYVGHPYYKCGPDVIAHVLLQSSLTGIRQRALPKGNAVKETGSLFTFAMLKGEKGWRIVGWSWAKNNGPA